ncbi:Holliday junction DNA helicase subunit RuvA [Balneicella halophila]|uniref:Holliday junction branch migration complex subunit RuvA n=1 Tax=Balneicella halophila TaxID=1537566 RepID=A0A7L4UPJ2_BALHA|nr:Holliday junction branch migration protein RuvA [Balneicella halophila]PVX51063.1 Holliday junction DNA helicase subunit RuvA [Balneicella halophila]
MYEYISGKLIEITPTYLVVDANGIGYRTHISLNTYTSFQNKNEAKVYIHQVVKEDSNEMFGFAEKAERSMFLLLISVSGVGAATGLMMLSAMGLNDIKEAIASGDVAVLQSIKGIGAKTAQRIIIDLKDKVVKLEGETFTSTSAGVPKSQEREEAIAALLMLGFKKNIVEKAINKIIKAQPDASVEEIIKLSLKQL